MKLFTGRLLLMFALGATATAGANAYAEDAASTDPLLDLTSLTNLSQPALPDDPASQQTTETPATPPATAGPGNKAVGQPTDQAAQGKQTKRILFLVPNFRAVSADEHLPPQTVKQKFKTAALDSLDYSSFIFVAGQAAVAQADNSYPEFRQGAAGFGRYYWHTLADEINENTWVEFIIPAALHLDSRYYTLGRGSFVKRLGYAFSRVAITRTDSGKQTFNFSEFVGAGAFSGVANTYYPSQERTFTKTYQRWIENLAIDSCVYAVKEIWPDINNAIFHQKD
jgi:hypothetical protein